MSNQLSVAANTLSIEVTPPKFRVGEPVDLWGYSATVLSADSVIRIVVKDGIANCVQKVWRYDLDDENVPDYVSTFGVEERWLKRRQFA